MADLDPSVLAELEALTPRSRERVAVNLVMAGRLLEDDPEAAHAYAAVAGQGAQRLAVVREAMGVTAYAAQHYDEAAKHLRAARRISGSDVYLAMLADCERALGRPERALDLAREVTGERPARQALSTGDVVELRIVAAGAMRDLGREDDAQTLLESADLESSSKAPWVARLRYAYADLLGARGDVTAAREWFGRAAEADSEGSTDAEERLVALANEDAGA